MTSRSGRWLAVVIGGAVATAAGLLLPLLARGALESAKGGPEPNPFLPVALSALMLAGLLGLVAGFAGVAGARPSWRRSSVLSVSCGGLALLLVGSGTGIIPIKSVGLGYVGIWLGGLLSLAAIGAGIGTFLRPMHHKALDMSLAVLGLLAGITCALVALWILGLTIGPGTGE